MRMEAATLQQYIYTPLLYVKTEQQIQSSCGAPNIGLSKNRHPSLGMIFTALDADHGRLNPSLVSAATH